MQFKVGDRVEVLKPAQGTGFSQKNNIGRGTVEAINDDVSEVCVRVDTNDLAWWYDIESVRPLTPSITVGTQVRLTGVVTGADGSGNLTVVLGEDFEVWIHPNKIPLEVIRQPFKRGEVVWQGTTELSVLADEEGDTVLLVEPMVGAVAFGADANLFERRP